MLFIPWGRDIPDSKATMFSINDKAVYLGKESLGFTVETFETDGRMRFLSFGNKLNLE